ncbi:tyrosine-protein phosphatase [Microbacterium sp. Bi121]|uniref:tyrosine-protein phosphatase n=1 Tax=Microbacterium sp. Bi121 TaxID=2822348 RepID=UPI001D85F082|nr:tyrosine-protein phosphatase [Microbacterium sp. Bi121]CAH0192076.1 Tyrosine-protein phosphatase [Microbacterium sp. Bi121]
MVLEPPGDAAGRLDVPGTYNFREVAPGVLASGRLYRSDALHRLDKAGRRRIGELGIRTVLDLRSAIDRRLGGRDRLRGTGAIRVSVPIDGTPRAVDLATITLADVYRAILTRHQPILGRIIREIAASDGPVLVHCTAGKDRTGLIVALTLAALDIDRRVILADYAATAANLAGEWTERMLRKVRRFRVPVTDEIVAVLTGSPAEVLDETLDWIDSEYGGMSAYLDGAGVDSSTRAALRAKLLPPA